MVKQILLPILAVIAFITVIGLYTQGKLGFLFPQKPSVANLGLKPVVVGSKSIEVEIVDTPALRQKGLAERTSLPENTGMLFVFDSKPVSTRFWMKGMLIPIDIIWIKNGNILKIDKNIEAPTADTSESQLKMYSTNEPIDYVLEVNSGFSDKYGLKPGDTVDLSKI